MGTSYDPTTYLNQQATTAPFTSRAASAARPASFKSGSWEVPAYSDRIEVRVKGRLCPSQRGYLLEVLPFQSCF